MKVNTLNKASHIVSLVAVLLTPLFFLPITSEFYEFNKQALLVLLAIVSLGLWVAKFIVDRQVRITRSPLGLPLLLLAFTWVISAFLKTPNRFDAFMEPSQVGTMIALIVLFFTGINAVHAKKQVDNLVMAFLGSMIVLSVAVVLFATGLVPAILQGGFLKNALWTPVGNPFSALLVLVAGLIFSGVLLVKQLTEKKSAAKVLVIASLVACTLGSALLTYRLFLMPNNPNRPVFLSQSVSWSIALEAIKSSPLFGTGPATYLSDFTRFRPLAYNSSPVWAVRFASSSNYYLQTLTTLGILGLIAYLFVLFRTGQMTLRSFKTSSESSLHSVAVAASVTALVVFASQLFLPVSLTSLAVLFFLLLILVAAFKQLGSSMVHEANVDLVAASDSGVRSPILPWVSLALVLLLILPTLYYASRAYAAEILFQRALTHAANNAGKDTYDTLIKTITAFPYRDSYRVAYSQTNLLLANSLASKKDLTPEDRQTIANLIQQSIREAKNAVALNPLKVTNVENMAAIYRSLIPLAKGADQWTASSYVRAIQLDPVNPNLNVALGGVLYQLKQYDQAIQVLTEAVNKKPDLANSYYNLSAAYREKGDLARAAAAMQAVVNNVKKDSADYTKAVDELAALKKKLGEKQATSASTVAEPAKTELTAPQPLPSPKLSPQVELPADAAPEVSVTPASQPAVTTIAPTAKPTVSPTTTP